MSATQTMILLEHLLDKHKHNVYFRFRPTDHELRLHIWFEDDGGNRFHRSFGPDGRSVEIDD